MNVAFDARYIEKEGSGVSVYASNILKQFSSIKEINLHAIITQHQLDFLRLDKRIRTIISPYRIQDHPLQEIWFTFILPNILKKNNIQILFCPGFIVPLKKPSFKIVAMIHDLAFHYVPFSMKKRFALYASLMTSLVVKKSDFILTPTENVKNEMLQKYRINAKNIYAVHHGKTLFQSGLSYSDRDSELFLQKMGIRQPYLLFVGNIEPRKDIVRLIDLFQHLRTGKDFQQYQLVLCGKKQWKWNSIRPRIQDKMQNVIFTGYTPRQKLEMLYKKSEAVMASSLYEGFGFPVIEGLQSEKVVFASDIPCFREVCGDCAVFINLGDRDTSARTVMETLLDRRKKRELVEKGKAHLQKFSWKVCAENVLHVFQAALQ
ncbi:MAG: glycosyltransferase family 4 protein [Candidatus Aureabacteria bacterium]|nr:glycosyltransferase family 4 protein [Candidatus Auribacterota bacterium]